MIWFEELQSRKKISRIFSVYEKTFPEEERRDKEQFLALSENPDVYIFSIKHHETAIGYAVLWEIADFHFLEHFEVFAKFRNHHFGTEILMTLQEKFPKVVLESEPENLNETARKRIGFYRRNGFEITDKNYIQPNYAPDKNTVNLYLLSNFAPDNSEILAKKIHDIVYL